MGLLLYHIPGTWIRHCFSAVFFHVFLIAGSCCDTPSHCCVLSTFFRAKPFSIQTWGPEAFARRTRTKIHNFGAPLPPWESKEQRPTPAARGIPKSINIILLGPTGKIKIGRRGQQCNGTAVHNRAHAGMHAHTFATISLDITSRAEDIGAFLQHVCGYFLMLREMRPSPECATISGK